MTDNINVQIIEPPLNNLIIETQIGSEPVNVNVVSYSGTNISVTHDLPILPSDINDNVAGLLVAGSGIVISYDNNIPSLTISSSGAQLDAEQVQDIIGSLITGSGYVVVNYNDGLNNLVVSVTGLQPSGNYSLAEHTHTSNDILDFNNAVSGLLPVKNISSGSGISVTNNSGDFLVSITGQFGLTSEQVDDRVNDLLVAGSYISLNYNDNADTLTIGTTGLQPSGNYSTVGHSHIIGDVSGLQVALDNKQPSGIYASGIHTHVVNDITNFNSGVSGLLPTLSGSQYIVTNLNNNIYSITATGLQPSGSYASSIHSHISNDITDFNTSVSGLVDGIYAPLDSPSFSGIPTAPTASGGTNTNQIASTSFVRNEISNLVNSAPSTLDTLNELASALGDDPNFATTIASGLGQKANLSGALFTGSVTIPSGTGNFNNLTLNGTNVSVSGHTHTSSDITNFNSSVSGLLPSVSGSGYVSSVFSNNGYTISVSGLQPSGNYSVDGHSHTSVNITDFNSSVSGLLPSVSGTGYVVTSFDNNVYTVSVTGLQPSGNYSVDGHVHIISDVSGLQDALDSKQPSGVYASGIHYHVSSDITDFNSSVSGLIPVKNINAGSGIEISSISGDFTVSVTGSFGLTSEGVDDRVNDLLVAGTGIVLNYDDNANTLTVSSTGLQPSGNYSIVGHSHVIADVSGLQVSLDNKQPSGIYASGVHNHISTDITDFNTSVSGLLPVIANSGDNRILTSTGSTVGVNAESNLTFDGNLLSVSGNLVAVSGTYDQLIFNTSLPDPDLSQGQLQWNNSEGTLDLGFTDTYSQHVGEELHYRVRNNTASTLVKGTAVYASGLTPGGNNRIEVVPFTANGSVREVRFMGLVTENIAVGVNGYTTQFGYIRGIDTRGDAASNGYAGKLWDAGEPIWSEGDILYAHPTVAGKLTKVEPKHSISVAIILNRHQNNGKIFVRPTSYGHLNDNHDVNISGATNGQFLQYNASTDYWIPSSSGNFSTLLVNGTGVSLSGHSHISSDITDFNASVSGLLPVTNILAGSNITVSQSGTNFTVAVTGSLGLTTEEVDDRVASLLVAGSGIVLDYDDNNNILNIDANFSTSLAAGTGISLDYNISTDELFINTSGNYAVNKLINGNFDIWQRGTSLAASANSTVFLTDRFASSSVGTTKAPSRQSFTLGQTDVPNEPTYFSRNVIGSVAGSSNYAHYFQKIENVRTFAGKTITLSFYAKADSNKPISVEFAQSFGTGGSPSAIVNGIGVQKLNLTSSWQKFIVTANIPSIVGKSLGSNNDHHLALAFWFDAGSSFNSRTNNLGQQSGTFDIAQVQLEEGPYATSFEQRPIGTELALCQRYFQSYPGEIINAGYTTNGTAQVYTMFLPVAMRISPVINFTPANVQTATLAYFDDGGSKDRLFFGVFSTSSTGGVFQYTAQNVTLDAEL